MGGEERGKEACVNPPKAALSSASRLPFVAVSHLKPNQLPACRSLRRDLSCTELCLSSSPSPLSSRTTPEGLGSGQNLKRCLWTLGLVGLLLKSKQKKKNPVRN
uniref:Uncharacterized protein n=1 Tax=Micrurus carvalhoi TaxID=3147026 RepID=A0A2H6N8C6_9SAUR